MKKLLIVSVCGGLVSTAALAADPYEEYLTRQKQRGVEIEQIRVASEKPLVAAEESDADVAKILQEVEELEADASDSTDNDDNS